MGTKLIIKDAEFTAIDFDLDTTKTLVSIAVTTPPTKTSYTTDDYFNPTGMVVTATYDDSSTEVITNYTYSPTTKLTTSVTAITISYRGKTTTTPITVTQATKTLVSIEATYTQGQTVVYPNTSLDSLKSNLVVVATYDDTSEQTLQDSDYTLSGTLAVGTSTITATYNGKTDTFSVVVSQPVTLESIDAVYTQSGTVYNTTPLDSLKTDLVVTATYSDSTTSTIPSTDYTLSGTLSTGTSTITVTYEGEEDTFTVTVTQAVIPSQDTEVQYTTLKQRYIFSPSGTVIGEEPVYLTNSFLTAYNVYEADIDYLGAKYQLVGNTNWGSGTEGYYDGYNIIAVVLDSLGKVEDVIIAHQKNGNTIQDDRFVIDTSLYSDAATIQFANNYTMTLTALSDKIVPGQDTVITDSTREKTNYIFEPNTVAVGGTLDDATSYIYIGSPTYYIDSYEVDYPGAYYSIVGNTNWGGGRPGKYDGYNIEAVVLDDLGYILDVIPAHQKDGSQIYNDTFYINMSQYANPTKLLICHSSPATLTALADTPSATE